MTNQSVKIVGVVVTATVVTLYKEDGSCLFLKQGDPAMRHVATDLIPAIKAKGFGMYAPTAITRNPYAEYEQQSGLVKFFSVAKKKLAAFFSSQEEELVSPTEPVEPCKIGIITHSVSGVAVETKPTISTKVTMDDLMASAVSVNDTGEFDSSQFVEPIDLNASSYAINDYEKARARKDKVLIATVGDTVIPEADRLLAQVTHSLDKGNTVGMDNLIRRLSAIVSKRQHTVTDVLKFIQRADLGISDNGDVIVYKALNIHKNVHTDLANESTVIDIFNGNTIYVDKHSGRVNQRVGMLVCVGDNYVDESRHVECAQGLHVARRAYLKEFECDACVVCAVRPEDFIAVPHADYNKVRVSAYHILAELPNAEYRLLMSNRSIANTATGKAILDKAMRNAYPEPSCKVTITKAKGGGLIYSWLGKDKLPAKPPVQEEVESVSYTPAVEDSLANANLSAITEPAKVVNPQDLGNSPTKEEVPTTDPKPKVNTKAPKKPTKVSTKSTKEPKSKGSTVKTILEGKSPSDLTEADKEALWALKRKKKKSWQVLGVAEDFQKVL